MYSWDIADPRSLVSLDYSQYHRYYHLSSWSSLAPRRARSGGQPRRTWGQAHELCSDRALRRPAVARCAAPPGAAPMPFPAFRCLHPKRAVAPLGHLLAVIISSLTAPWSFLTPMGLDPSSTQLHGGAGIRAPLGPRAAARCGKLIK